MLGIISYKDWQKLSQAILTESKVPEFKNQEEFSELILENFAEYSQYIRFSNIQKQNYFLMFFDLIGSTQSINRNLSAKDIFQFLQYVLNTVASIFGENFEFKLVGDGVLILIPIKNKQDLKIIKDKLNSLKKDKKSVNSHSHSYRIVCGLGTLECFHFYIKGLSLKECIGRPISCLVKLSKDVKEFKEFKPEELLNCP